MGARGREFLRAAGLEPAQALRPNGFSYHFDFRRRIARSWSGLSLHRSVAALGAPRLVSTPSHRWAWLGITSEGFPEFGRFYSSGFPQGTQLSIKSGMSTIPSRSQAFLIAWEKLWKKSNLLPAGHFYFLLLDGFLAGRRRN